MNRSVISLYFRVTAGLSFMVRFIASWHSLLPRLYQAIFQVSLSYYTVFLSYIPKGRLRNFNRLGDYSHGLFLYALPVQQCCAAIVHAIQPLQMLLPSSIAASLLALLHCHAMKIHALKQKLWFLDILSNGMKR